MDKSLTTELIEYKAPFLIEKLIKENIVETPEEGEKLFLEVKKWLIIIHFDNSKNWEMYSLRIDEVWHQFILYTGEYIKFCHRFFDSYVQHSPSNAPKVQIKGRDIKEPGSFDDFRICYENFFGIPIPQVWFDERSVTVNRRVVNYFVKKLRLSVENGVVNLFNSKGKILMSVNEIASEAVAYIATTPAFYVRELPGGLTNEEKIGLIKSLVEFKILRAGY